MIWRWKITVATDDFDIPLTLEQWDIEITKGSDSRFNCSSSCNQKASRLKQATSSCFMDHHRQQRRNSSSNRYSQDISSHEQLFWGNKNADPAPANTQWRPEHLKGQKYANARERRKKLRLHQKQWSSNTVFTKENEQNKLEMRTGRFATSLDGTLTGFRRWM